MSASLITTLTTWVIFLTVFSADPLERCPPQLNRGAYLKAHDDKCYEFVTYDERTWNVAKTACTTQGGSLAEISDKNIQQFISDSLRQLDYDKRGLWIGLSDSEKEGTWRWVKGDTVSYSNWASGHGGFLGFVEDCALLRASDGKWEELPCGVFWDRFGFICQYDMMPLSTNRR